ncbi:hypothetical protein PAHA111176_03475 [Parendozoicomonas haliclonae]|uniref:Uncharacterized protein n=2 Tax=Parendozoicomonas haliclonae TaxID=1960125 RepID=A0A1X7AJT4_9GAMM|nr:hypothetical protein EHSB41UT_02058 [Parendozoicomonas haliclonae]
MYVHGCIRPWLSALLWCVLATAFLGLTLSGCSTSPLPSGHKRSHTSWTNFGEAKKAYDKVIVGKSDFRELKELGFDPFSIPNVKRLTYLDVINFFMPNPAIQVDQLAPGLQQCIFARARCFGVEAWPKVRNKKRYGNVMLDLMDFQKNEEITGWEFRSVIVLVDNRVVFKIWSGTPQILEYNDERNPLGPIQGASDYFLD